MTGIGHISGGSQTTGELKSKSLPGKGNSNAAPGDEWTKDYVKKGDLVDLSLELKNIFAREYGRDVCKNSLVTMLGSSIGLGFAGYLASMAAGINPIIGLAAGVVGAVAFTYRRDANQYGRKELEINHQTREKTYFAGLEPTSRLELNARISTEMGTGKETSQKFILDSKSMDKIMSGFDRLDDSEIEKFSDCREQLVKLEKDRRLLGHIGLKTLNGRKVLSLITAVDAVNFLASGKKISVIDAGTEEKSGYEYGIKVKRADSRSYRTEDGHRNISSVQCKIGEISSKADLVKVADGKGLPPGVVGIEPMNNGIVSSDGFRIVGHSLHYEYDSGLGLVVRKEREQSQLKSVT